jgi:GAF domain-containing protein/anti-sigma regulatory factor (Ser/Thr protein kinase)
LTSATPISTVQPVKNVLARNRRSGSWAGWRSYVIAVAAVALAFGLTVLLSPLTDEFLFSPLVGTVVIVTVYLGVGPGLAGTAVGWLAALFGYVEQRWSLRVEHMSDLAAWGIGLGVALVLIWASWTLQQLREAERRRAAEAEETTAVSRQLHELAAGLASAATPAEVAGVLLARVPPLLGAEGGSLGLVEGDALAIVDPVGGPRPAIEPGARLALTTRAPITAAARTGEVVAATTREAFASDFPDGAALAPYAASAVAVPLRAEGKVVGAIGFPFRRPEAADDNIVSLAKIAAELGGQALGRSFVYERERAAREGLERIARLAPRFADAPEGTVVHAVCREAREMFEADVAQLWKVRDGLIETLWRDPPDDSAPAGRLVEPQDYPGMKRSLERLDTTFFPDARKVVTGDALDRVMAEGVRSLMRVPIVVGGRPELVLALRWSRVIPEPSPQLLAVLRRFADHAGLVIEHGERRRAERTEQLARTRAERLAGNLAQLHSVATALGAATTALEIAALVSERVLAHAGAERVIVYGVTAGGELQHLASATADAVAPAGSDPLEASGRASDVPTHPVWPDDAETPGTALLPLLVEGEPVGILSADFASGRHPDESTRRLIETIAGQTGPPLERAGLHEREHEARIQAELAVRRTRRLQALTSAFAGALTQAEVAEIFLDQTVDAVGASVAALAVLDEEGRELQVTSSRRALQELLSGGDPVPVAGSGPLSAAVRGRVTTYYDARDALADAHPELRDGLTRAGFGSFAFLTVSAGGAPLGVAALAWEQAGRLVDEERSFLEAVVAQCGLSLDRALRYEGERVVAETLQRSVLPEAVPSMEGVRVSALYLPGSTAVDVGGDWFDTLTLPDGRLGFVVGDVVGKGVQAAATMAQLRNGMRALTLDATSPSETLTKLNLLLESYIDVPFATVAYLVLDPDTLEVALVSAGHPPPLVVSQNAPVRFLEGGGGLPLGVNAEAGYEEYTTTLTRGSIVVLYTDGLVERRGRSIDDGLSALASAASRAPREPDAFVDYVIGELVGADARQDDVAVLAIMLDPARLLPLELTMPAAPESLQYLRDQLARWLDAASVPDVDARDIVLATWEAGANAIEHAGGGRDAVVRVDAVLSGDRVRIGVVDRGSWKEPEVRHDRGLGLRLMEALMTTVDVDRGPDGTRVVMERPLTREPPRGYEGDSAEG